MEGEGAFYCLGLSVDGINPAEPQQFGKQASHLPAMSVKRESLPGSDSSYQGWG